MTLFAMFHIDQIKLDCKTWLVETNKFKFLSIYVTDRRVQHTFIRLEHLQSTRIQ